MRFPPFSRLVTLLLTLLVVWSTMPSLAGAQEPIPSTPAAEKPQTSDDVSTAIRELPSDSAESSPVPTIEAAETDAVANDSTRSGNETNVLVSSEASAPDQSPAPLDEALLIEAQQAIADQPNAVKPIDVATPNGVQAGEALTYTYTFTNTTSTADILIQAWWLDFSETTLYGNKQSCDSILAPPNCNPIPESIQAVPAGSTSVSVNRETCPTGVSPASSICYRVSGVGANKTGRFAVRLRVQKTLYPQTNKAITSLSGSAKLLPNGSATAVSEDTASTLVAGPVLQATKTAVTTGSIYTGDNGKFKISVGNATGTNDKPSGILRADARTATGIIVTDVIPIGSVFVSANPPATGKSDKEVWWEFAGPLKPGEKLSDIEVTFQKIGGSSDCARLYNQTLRMTSKEYPFQTGEQRYTVTGGNASIPVIAPLQIKSVAIAPQRVYFGDTTTIEITVQNFRNQALNGVNLAYDIQSNASYGGGASPAPAVVQAKRVEWNFSIAAGSIDRPTELKFLVPILADYTTTVANTPRVTLTPPQGVSTDCNTKDVKAQIQPRLSVKKITEEDVPKRGTTYFITEPREFEYIIELTNNGNTPATNVNITDTFPSKPGANFTYVPGSAKIGESSTPIEPSQQLSNGMIWTNLQVGPDSTLQIRYRLVANGYNYVDYCNQVAAESLRGNDKENVSNGGGTTVCVRLNPAITTAKTVDKPNIALSDTTTPINDRRVTYTLTATNNSGKAQQFGFADVLPKGVTYEGVVANSTSPVEQGSPTLNQTTQTLTWPVLTINAGQTFTVKFTAIVDDTCGGQSNVERTNTLKFQDDKPGLIEPFPAAVAKTIVNCGKVEYSIKGLRSRISLRDYQDFEVVLKNTSKTLDATNLPLEVRLPDSFTFVGVNTGSAITTPPTTEISGTFTTLKWTVPSVKRDGQTGSSITVKFRALSGLTVLPNKPEDNALVRTSTNGKCVSPCVADVLGGALYSASSFTVDALITLEPRFVETGCARIQDKRTYELKVVNRNDHDYRSTVVTVTLPLGLEYAGAVNNTAVPTISVNGNQQVLTWQNQIIPKANGAVSGAKQYSVQVLVNGRGGGALATVGQATSIDGAFPPRTGVVDPTVFVCLDRPGLWFTANRPFVGPGEEIEFQVQAVNPKTQPYTLSFEYAIPAELEYIGPTATDQGNQPTLANNKLVWTSQVLPAAKSSQEYSQLNVTFRLRVKTNVPLGRTIQNKIVVTSNQPADPSLPLLEVRADSAPVGVRLNTHLPFTGK